MASVKWLRLAALAAAYAAVARLGLLFDAVSGFASLVWPPTGLAIAAVVIGGARVWPAILVGAFAANVWAGAPVVVACGIAVGNTLEAVAAGVVLGRAPGFERALGNVRSAIWIVVVAIAATAISASIGVGALLAGHVIGDVAETWRAWWVGDMLGALVVAPLLLVFATASAARPLRSLEGIAGLAVLVATSWLVLGPTIGAVHPFQQVYAVFPVLTWLAVRFGPRGAAAGTFAVAAIAIAATTLGVGPFARETLRGGLMELQVFVAFVAATFMTVAALASERMRAARDAEQKRRELETALQSTRVARQHAEHASAVKSDFLSMVSHELRMPLATLLLQIERLHIERGELADPMRAQGQRLAHLIDGLLDYARIQSGRLTLQIETIDPRALVADCVEELRPMAAQKQLALEVDTSSAPATFASDEHLLRLVVINLVGNALKFTKEGRVDVTVASDGDALRISVRDTGPGIAPQDQQRVFEPFEQVDPVRRKHVPGVGLGLTLVRALVDALGGQISLESTRGLGSTFALAFPPSESAPRRG